MELKKRLEMPEARSLFDKYVI